MSIAQAKGKLPALSRKAESTSEKLTKEKTKKMLREKEHSPKLFLDSSTLDFISSVASFYKISRSEVVEWAICASLRPYDKAFKIATRRIYARCQAEKKVQNASKQQSKAKVPSTQEGLKSKQLFDPRAY